MNNEEYVQERGHLFKAGNTAASNRGPNKVSSKVKESLAKFLEDNIDHVQESFDKLKPIEKLQFIANILPYIVPKLSTAQVNSNNKLHGTLNVRWVNPRSTDSLRHSENESNGRESMGLREGLSDNSEPRGD